MRLPYQLLLHHHLVPFTPIQLPFHLLLRVAGARGSCCYGVLHRWEGACLVSEQLQLPLIAQV